MATKRTKKDRSPAVDDQSLSPDELAERVAILHRFRDLLTQQRDRFRSYLTVLEKQQTYIESGDTDELLSYVELEEQIITDIHSIQKVIDPLEKMYHMDDNDVSALKTSLEDLKTQAVARSSHNKELLSTQMGEVRSEITVLRNNPIRGKRSPYSDSDTASIIDIEG
jgi:hypothetical protein